MKKDKEIEKAEKQREGLLKKADNAIQEAEKNYLLNRTQMCEEQKKEIAEIRSQYFQKERLGGKGSLSQVEKALGSLGMEVYKTYLPYVKEIYIPSYEISCNFTPENRIVYFDITRWVRDKEEKNIDKLINVYQVLANENCNIALIYTRTNSSCKVTMAIVNTDSEKSRPEIAKNYKERVINALSGNFPGVEIITDGADGIGAGIPKCLKQVVKYNEASEVVGASSVAVVSNLPADKSEDFISQSMEKLLDGIVPEGEKAYSLVLLATPSKNCDAEKNRIYEIYKGLAPYASWQENYSVQDNTTLGAGSSLAKSVGANLGVSANAHFGVDFIGDVGVGVGASAGANFGANFGKTANFSIMSGKSEGETKTCTNYAVKHALELLEEQIKRLEECSALGMWEFAAYSVSEDPILANNVATMYLALTQGEKSYLSQNAINFWHGKSQRDDAACILESLKRLHHPHFVLDPDKCKDSNSNIALFKEEIDLFTILSGKELVRALNFPRKSVAGFTVIESAPFGREVQRFSVARKDEADILPDLEKDEPREIEVGNIVHMYKEESQKVKLDIDSFTSHVFVTGSTGTGKSNTIYQLLTKAIDKGSKVMVIEPAKGEYNSAIGALCKTYGTNPLISDVLRINPFSFPTGESVKRPIHVLEHIDRLIEILNACWPMYAAMPAVLKDAIELAYQNKGWDLYTSECYPLRFPTFGDLLETLPEVMNNSMYSNDTKSDYAGALVTRVNSLTNGINGLVFCSDDEVPATELFANNVIVDISRVGSNETKSMLMGILIMKLQEHHLSDSGVNEDLKHITVLEEAHNLLRRTSSVQSQDSGNLQGKAVEMLANSIAEMRTYGEGFIIADQAPGILDESVIRNTNTKIILRLPDAEDRKLVGKAAALSDEQIDELAKLPRGVATVYQNDWVEAVLCQFERFNNCPGDNMGVSKIVRRDKPSESFFEMLFNISDIYELEKEETDTIVNWIDKLALPSSTKTCLRRVLGGEKLSESESKAIAYNLFEGKRMAKYLRDSIDTQTGIDEVDTKIKQRYDFDNDMLVVQIRQLILQYVSDHMKTGSFESRYMEFMGRGKA